MTNAEQLTADRKNSEIAQDRINADFNSGGTIDELEGDVRQEADLRHQPHPQYRGHWDAVHGWRLVRINRRVNTKLGDAFLPGDVTLGKLESNVLGCGPGWSVYSIRNGVDTIVAYGVEIL